MKGICINPASGHLTVEKGRLKIAETTQQVIALVLLTKPGEWKEHPIVGADVHSLLGGIYDPLWASEAKRMINACGVDATDVVINTDGTITVM